MHAHLNISVGPISCILKTCFGPLKGASGFAQFTIKEKQNTSFVQNSNYAHAQQLKNEEDLTTNN